MSVAAKKLIQVLFLDVDGVLNNSDFYHRRAEDRRNAPKKDSKKSSRNDDLDPDNLAQLAILLELLPDLKIVISSTWRFGKTLEQLRDLLAIGFDRDRIIGATSSHESRMRYMEIEGWIRYAEEKGTFVSQFIALDDDSFDMHQLGDNFIHVNRKKGLTSAEVEKVVKRFRR